MNDAWLERYARHIFLDDIDIEGQRALAKSRIVVVGVGGLGSVVSLYLAAAGVGELDLIDDDHVSVNNLQRQIAFTENSVGHPKVAAAAETLRSLNSGCRVNIHNTRFSESLVATLLPSATLVLDCSDNYATRSLINTACVAYKKPLVSGAALVWDGQLTVIDPRREGFACYACLYPNAPKEERACSENGVVGPLVGIIGSSQALEAIKIVCGIESGAVGRVGLYSGREGFWHYLSIERNHHCEVCGSERP